MIEWFSWTQNYWFVPVPGTKRQDKEITWEEYEDIMPDTKRVISNAADLDFY